MHYSSIFEYKEALDFLIWLRAEHGVDPKALRSAAAILNKDFVINCAGGHACGNRHIINQFADTVAGEDFATRIAKKAARRIGARSK